MADADRPQDVGRRHVRRPRRGDADRALVERYQAAMRRELEDCLTELEGTPQPDGLHGPVPPKRPDVAGRSRIWDLAMKLGRELGAAIDPDPLPDGPPAPAKRKVRGRVDYGGA